MITKDCLKDLTYVSEYNCTTNIIHVEVDPDVIEAFLRTVFGDGDYTYSDWVNTTFTIKRQVEHD